MERYQGMFEGPNELTKVKCAKWWGCGPPLNSLPFISFRRKTYPLADLWHSLHYFPEFFSCCVCFLNVLLPHDFNVWLSNTSTHSSTLAWKIPWMEEPGRLQSMGSLRVGHDWATSLSLFTFMHWRRKWQSTPVFLPGESLGQGSLVGCHLWRRTELDTTEVT